MLKYFIQYTGRTHFSGCVHYTNKRISSTTRYSWTRLFLKALCTLAKPASHRDPDTHTVVRGGCECLSANIDGQPKLHSSVPGWLFKNSCKNFFQILCAVECSTFWTQIQLIESSVGFFFFVK